MEGDFAIIAFRKLFTVDIVGFVEPTIEIVGTLHGIITGDVSCKYVMISGPCVGTVGVGWHWQTVGA